MIPPDTAALRFGAALLLGLGLGLVYGFLRPLRPRHTAVSDLLFLAALFAAWLYLGFALCQGDLRVGISAGLAVGFFPLGAHRGSASCAIIFRILAMDIRLFSNYFYSHTKIF